MNREPGDLPWVVKSFCGKETFEGKLSKVSLFFNKEYDKQWGKDEFIDENSKKH